MSGTTDFLYNKATDFGTLYTQTTDGIAQLQKLPAIKDTTSACEDAPPLNGWMTGYSASTGHPQLPVPDIGNNPAGLDHAIMMLTNFPEVILGAMDAIPIPKGEDKFGEEMEGMLGEVDEATLAKFGNGDPKLGLAKLKYAILHNGGQFPPDLKALAATIHDKAFQAGGYGPNELIVGLGDTATPVIYRAHFEGAVRSAGLSDDEMKQVFFASDFPEAAASLPPKLQKILQEAESGALAQTSKELGLPSDWKIPRNTAVMKEMLGEKIEFKVSGQLNTLLESGKISRAEFNELRTLMAMPGADTPHAAKLAPILQGLLQAATAELQKDYGIPANFPLTADSSGHEALLNGSYFAEFNKQLGNPSLNLTAGQQAQLKAALSSDKAAAALPPELKTILENVKAATLAKVSVTYGLPENWAPDTNALSAAAIRTETPAYKCAQEGLNQGIESYNTGKKILSDIEQGALARGEPPPTLGVLLKDYLKAISQVLITMQEMLSKQAISDTKVSNTMSIMERDSKIGELDKRQKSLDEIAAKQKKMASLGPLKAAFQWIINILLIMLLGPVGIILLINSTVHNLKENHGKLNMGKMNMIEDLAKTMEDVGKSIGGPFGKALGGFAKIAAMVLLEMFCPMAIMMDMMIGEGTFLKEILTGLGIPKDKADMIAMVVQMVYQLVVGIILMFFTAGASWGPIIAKMAESAGEMAIKALQVVNQVASMIGRILEPILSVIQTVFPALGELVEAAAQSLKNIGTKAIQMVQDFVDSAIMHGNNLSEAVLMNASALEETLQTAKSTGQGVEAAQAAYDAAYFPIKQAEEFSSKCITYLTNSLAIGYTVVTTAVNTNNKILQAQIERIKADLEANRIIVEEFIKILKQLIDKLLETIKGIGQDIKEVVDAHKKLFEGLSQVIASLFQA